MDKMNNKEKKTGEKISGHASKQERRYGKAVKSFTDINNLGLSGIVVPKQENPETLKDTEVAQAIEPGSNSGKVYVEDVLKEVSEHFKEEDRKR